MLRSLQHHGSTLAHHVHDPLHTQQIGPAQGSQRLKRRVQPVPVEGLVEPQAERANRGIVRAGLRRNPLLQRAAFLSIPIVRCERIEPAPKLLGPDRHASWTDVGKQLGIELAADGRRHERERIHRVKSLLQTIDRFVVRDVGLGDDDTIGYCRLLDRFGHGVELAHAVDRVDQCHDAIQPVLGAEQAVGLQCVQHRNRIGESGGFHEHAVEVDNLSRAPLDEQLPQRVLKVRAQRAAQAAVRKQRHLLRRRCDQLVIDGDFAEFIDDDGGPLHTRVTEHSTQQRRLAAAQKSGDDGDRQPARQRIDSGGRANAGYRRHSVISRM